MKVTLITGGTTTPLDQAEVNSLLMVHGVTHTDSDGTCNKVCTTCPDANEGCGAATEAAMPPTVH